jgi:NAD(P)-dependent dehydrogenase (short-subunit alcohol dehydrogenase family)
MTDKVAVVTGAASGIGRALAQQLGAKGWKLALCDIDAKGLAETAQPLGAMTRALDVSKREAVEAFAAAVLEKHGHVDLVVNNAGVDLAETIADVSYADFEWLFGINFWGVVYGTKAFLPAMLKRGSGAIVNVSSVFGLVGWPSHGTYSAAKFAVRGFTEALRHELDGTGVRSICVHPGGIRTNIVRNGRFFKDAEGSATKEASVAMFDGLARTTADKAAQTILRGVERGSRRILIGPDASAIDFIVRLLPRRHFGVFRAFQRWFLRR